VNHLAHFALDGFNRPVEGSVGRQAEEAPPSEGRIAPPVQHGENLVEMTLDHRPRRLQRVGVDAEGELHGDIDGEAREVAADIHELAPIRRSFPAPPQARDRQGELREEVRELLAVERRGDNPALAPPVLALGGEHAVEPHFPRHRLKLPRALEDLRSLHEYALDSRSVRNHDDGTRPHGKPEQGAIAVRPCFHLEMQPIEAYPVKHADQRQPSGAGKVPKRGQGAIRLHDSATLPLRQLIGISCEKSQNRYSHRFRHTLDHADVRFASLPRLPRAGYGVRKDGQWSSVRNRRRRCARQSEYCRSFPRRTPHQGF